jgi:hypothetical protein
MVRVRASARASPAACGPARTCPLRHPRHLRGRVPPTAVAPARGPAGEAGASHLRTTAAATEVGAAAAKAVSALHLRRGQSRQRRRGRRWPWALLQQRQRRRLLREQRQPQRSVAQRRRQGRLQRGRARRWGSGSRKGKVTTQRGLRSMVCSYTPPHFVRGRRRGLPFGRVWRPKPPRGQRVPVTDDAQGGCFVQHLPDARGSRQADQSALVQ